MKSEFANPGPNAGNGKVVVVTCSSCSERQDVFWPIEMSLGYFKMLFTNWSCEECQNKRSGKRDYIA